MDDAALVRASLDLADAIVSNNPDRIRELLAPEWRLIDADGVTTRERLLAVVASGELAHSAMHPVGELDARAYGDVGIVFGRVANTAHVGDDTFEADEWTTDVFARRRDAWICVHSHVTTVAPDADAST